ncbi:AAA family ATPase [Trichococcus shcherbakoviae]|uniref:AAA family ATPase n=1 Tax=Trichococcus shcherbakoviae TaxID=2094020 RepID=UPI002AA779BA|nr:AAA family ATPase [Trichococcus shcherbakoviae]
MKLLLLADSESERLEITEMLKNIDYIRLSGDSIDEEKTMESLDRSAVDILLMGSGTTGERYVFAEKVSHQFPLTNIIMIEEVLLEETMHNALFSGAKDVLIKPVDAEKLMNAIYRIHQLQEHIVVAKSDTPQKKIRKKELGQVYTVFSTKGGVGKTFVSINLAASLAKNSEKRVVLVDLDLDFGNAALALNLYPKFTIMDVIDNIRHMDSDMIESYLIPHESGIKVLPANLQPNMNDFINADHIHVVLEALRESFDYVVVDMPGRFVETIMPALALADQLLVITTPELSSVRNIKALLATLKDLNFPQSKIRIVLNKEDSKGEIKKNDVETTLNKKVDATIELDYRRVLSSLNRGVPLVHEYPKNTLSKNFEKMCVTFSQEDLMKA